MKHVGRATVAAAVLGFTLAASGCSTSNATKPVAATGGTPSAATQAGDALACDAVQTLVARLTADTAKWSPTIQPFDSKIQATILDFANNLEVEAVKATSENIQAQVRATALAFADLSTAMSRHDRAKFDQAIAQTRVEYKKLKPLCTL